MFNFVYYDNIFPFRGTFPPFWELPKIREVKGGDMKDEMQKRKSKPKSWPKLLEQTLRPGSQLNMS